MAHQKITILVVDDEAPVRKLLRRCFESEQYAVVEAATSEELFDQLKNNDVSLITLDISLGSENGLDIAKRIRAESDIGIIMVSGKGDLIDTVLGLELGADDYISKPFELREVIARTRSVLRRTYTPVDQMSTNNTEPSAAPVYNFGQWQLLPLKRSVVDPAGTELELTTAEFDLLFVLVINAQTVLSRNQIMDAMKGLDWNPNDRTIDNHIVKLRKKLDVDGVANIIKSVRGVGYVFSLDVTVV